MIRLNPKYLSAVSSRTSILFMKYQGASGAELAQYFSSSQVFDNENNNVITYSREKRLKYTISFFYQFRLTSHKVGRTSSGKIQMISFLNVGRA